MSVLAFPVRTVPLPESDLDGLALHLADLSDEDWRALTPARKAALRTIADFARAAAVETKHAAR